MDGTVRVKSLVWFATGVVVTLLATVIVMQTWRADAAPGEVDTTFVPITPGCRFADTRQPGQGGPIGPGQTRQFTARGVHNDCTIPIDAVAVLMNVTADRQTASNSFLSIWGSGANPGTSALNPAAGEPPTPNAVTTDLTGAGVFNVYNDAGSVDLIIDINGYYTKASLQVLDLISRFAKIDADSTGATILHSRGVKSTHRLVIGVYQVDFFEPVHQCGWSATLTANEAAVAEEGEITVERAGQFDIDSLWVRTHDSAGNPVDPADSQGFSLHLAC